MTTDAKFLNRQIQRVAAKLDRGQDDDALVAEVIEHLTPEQRHHALLHQIEKTAQVVVDEMVAAGELVDNGDGTYSKAV